MSTTINTAYVVGSGQTLSFTDPTGAVYTLTGYSGVSFLDEGSIQISSSQTNATAEAFTDDGTLGFLSATLTVALGGSVSVSATGSGANARGYISAGYRPAILENDGAFTVSATATAIGASFGFSNGYSPSFAPVFVNTGGFYVSAASATGVWIEGGAVFNNTGTLEVDGTSQAIGFDLAAITSFGQLTNSGSITVSATSGPSYGIYIDGSYSNLSPVSITNTGTITAQHAIYETDTTFGVSSYTPWLVLNNSGTITGDIVTGTGPSAQYQGIGQAVGVRIYNTGTIDGSIHLTTNGVDLYDGRGGHQTGGIYVGGGTDVVYLGDDGETVVGGTGSSVIFGGSGADSITGGSGADVISGGGGNDTLTGGLGANTFLMSAASGAAVITDFSDAQGDKIDLTALSAFASLSDVQAHAVQSGTDTVITLGAGSTLTLQNVQLSGLTASDFIFAHTYSPITAAGTVITGANVFTGTNAGAGAYAVAGVVTDDAFTQVIDGGAGDTAAGLVTQTGANLDVTASATLTVAASGSNSTAYGIWTSAAGIFSNEATISVSATGQATGIAMSANQYIFNDGLRSVIGSLDFFNHGELDVSGGVAVGVDSANPDGTVWAQDTNSGTISVAGVTEAIGIRMVAIANAGEFQGGTSPYQVELTNSGVISVTASAGSAYGIEYGGPSVFGQSASITNTGVITAQHAIAAIEAAGSAQDPIFALANSGTINGSIDLGYGPVAVSSFPPAGLAYDNQILNTGAINGTIQLSHNGHDLYDGRGGTQTGGIYLGGGSNVIYLGNDGETVYAGYGGSAVIYDGTGNDTVHAGAGNDTIFVGSGNDVVDGGGGTNTVSYVNATAGVTVSLGLQGQAQASGGAGTDTLSNFQNLTGSAFNDTLQGDGNNNVLDGGGGINTISYANATSGVTVSLALQGLAQNTVGAGTDTLSNFQNLIGSAYNDLLTTSTGTSSLTGGSGADTFRIAPGAANATITDFSHLQGDQIDLSAIPQFTSLSSVLAAATQNGADTVINTGTGSLTLKNVLASSLTDSDFVFATPVLHINVTYDSSAANAPAGFIAAVDAAVQFFERTFSNNITINIDVGWGEVEGQALGASAVAESIATSFHTTYQTLRAALIATDASSPAAGFAASNLPASDPTGGATISLTTAEAKALGLTASAGVDGYVGVSSSQPINLDLSSRASGGYDAVGAIEHEISEILGRHIYAGALSGSVHIDSALDLFRYSAANVHSYQPGAASFSLDGDQLLKAFNTAPSGDAGDWASSATPDPFDAFQTPGLQLDPSIVDIRVLELLGYSVGFTSPALSLTPVSPLVVSQTGSLGAGQSLGFNGPAAIVFSPTSSHTGPAYTNSGTISDDGTASQVDVVGVRYDPAAAATLAAGVASTFTNAASGALTVNAVATASDAVGVYFGANSLANAGAITAASALADAYGDVGVNYTGAATATLTVQAANEAIGLELTGNSTGSTASNAGSIQVSGLHAFGVTHAISLNNSGSIVATAIGAGALSTGVYIDTLGPAVSMTNSGVITAQTAIQGAVGAAAAGLVATILNTGTLNGAVNLGDGNITLDSRAGTINGTVTLGSGSDSATLGAGNDTVALAAGTHVVDGGGGTNTVSYANAASSVHVSLGSQGQAQSTGVGTDTLSDFQHLVGSAYGDRLEGGDSTSSTLTGGLGADTFVYQASDGAVTVTDFSAAQGDKIDLSGVSTLHSLNDVLATASQVGSDTVITVGAGSLLLQNLSTSNLMASDFIFTGPSVGPGIGGAPTIGSGTLNGTSGSDWLQGGSGNDILHGGAGSDYLDGGAGLNTALYDGVYRQYTVGAGGATVSGGPEGGTDDLVNIQRVQFVDGYLAYSPTDLAGQVYRLYEATLGRGPDAEGLAGWVNALNSGTTLQSVASGFVTSTEFQNVYGALDDSRFVTLLYNNVLHRGPDQGGLSYWLGYLAQGHTRAEVVLGFSESPEDVGDSAPTVGQGLWVGDVNAAEAARLYDTVFGREPDTSGLPYWTHALDSGMSLQTAADGFVASPEFQSAYAGLDDTGFLTRLYQNVLHRGPDAGGLQGWLGYLAAGHTRADVVLGFSDSAEHIANTAPHIDNGVWVI